MNDSELKLPGRTDPERSRGISLVILLATWGEIKRDSLLIPCPLAARKLIKILHNIFGRIAL